MLVMNMSDYTGRFWALVFGWAVIPGVEELLLSSAFVELGIVDSSINLRLRLSISNLSRDHARGAGDASINQEDVVA